MQIKYNTMKSIHILAFLLLFIGQTKAQNIVPLENCIDKREVGDGFPDGTYLKDVNHLLDPLIGTWQGSLDNKTYTFYITKQTITAYGITVDELVARHYIVDTNTGVTLEDSKNTTKSIVSGDYFEKDRSTYVLNYWGENFRCGQKGKIRIKSLSPTTMRFSYSWYPLDLARKEECPGGNYVKSFFPENVNLILNKQ